MKDKKQTAQKKKRKNPPQKPPNTIIAFLRRNRERVVLTGVALSFLLFIGVGILLQQMSIKEARREKKVQTPEKVELETRSEKSADNDSQESKGGETNSFYLKPSPKELLSTLQEMQHLRSDVAQEKLQNMRILWPLYFFEIRRSLSGSWVAVFDVAEDGFGVMVEAEYKSDRFPELEGLEAGKKIWVGGEIVGVDPSGTGLVQLKMEYIDFSFGIPSPARFDSVVQEK